MPRKLLIGLRDYQSGFQRGYQTTHYLLLNALVSDMVGLAPKNELTGGGGFNDDSTVSKY